MERADRFRETLDSLSLPSPIQRQPDVRRPCENQTDGSVSWGVYAPIMSRHSTRKAGASRCDMARRCDTHELYR